MGPKNFTNYRSWKPQWQNLGVKDSREGMEETAVLGDCKGDLDGQWQEGGTEKD